MEKHISSVCRSASGYLKSISKIRRFLSQSDAEKLVDAFNSSRIDSLLAGIPDCVLKPLKGIQNIAARIVSQCKKFEHVTELMKTLHWLPIRQRIEF